MLTSLLSPLSTLSSQLFTLSSSLLVLHSVLNSSLFTNSLRPPVLQSYGLSVLPVFLSFNSLANPHRLNPQHHSQFFNGRGQVTDADGAVVGRSLFGP